MKKSRDYTIRYMGEIVDTAPRSLRNGRFTAPKPSRTLRTLTMIIFFSGLLVVAHDHYSTNTQPLASGVPVAVASEVEVSPVTTVTALVAPTPNAIEDMKMELINEIAQCETRNIDQSEALIHPDNNKRKTLARKDINSLGVMQYKVSTVQRHVKETTGETITNYEATLLALDNERAKDLAKHAIFEIKGSLWAWTCATPAMGKRVQHIRDLEASIK